MPELDGVEARAREVVEHFEKIDNTGKLACCGGPHTSHNSNPYGHAVTCPVKKLHAALDKEDEFEDGR